MKADKDNLTFSNHDARFGHPLGARRSEASKVYAPRHSVGDEMKSKEMSCPSLSPWFSVLHTAEDSQSCSLLQPNKSALKRDILARRRNWGLAVKATSLSPPLPGNGGELPVPAPTSLRAGHTGGEDRRKSSEPNVTI